MSARTWLQRVERSSLHRQYVTFMTFVVTLVVLVTLVSGVTAVWTSWHVRAANERVLALHLANLEVRQDLHEAAFAVRGSVLDPGSAAHENRYETATSVLARDLRRLERLAAAEGLTEAVEAQERAIRAWFDGYADPRMGAAGPAGEASVGRGEELFAQWERVNGLLDQQIDEAVEEIRDRARAVLLWVFALVGLLALLCVAATVVAVRRVGDSVVRPLTQISQVLERLRDGDLTARAEPEGPEEIRAIARALNSLTDETVRAGEVEADVLTQLETIDRVRTDLVSTVSHELRTPLTSISGYLELLEDELGAELTPSQREMIIAVRRNLERLNELITNLLALSRAEETRLAVEPVDLRAVAGEVAADVRLQAAARDVAITTMYAPDPVTALGDRSQLTRAVQNLVTNAVKFSRPGGEVEVRVAREGDQAVLEVLDEGIGIPGSDLAHLGARFYRASNAVRAEIAGTGLGLRIVQTILDRHDGELAVESVEGTGSTFTVRLPLCRPAVGTRVRDLDGSAGESGARD